MTDPCEMLELQAKISWQPAAKRQV